VPDDPIAVIRRFYELSKVGDPACWEVWDEDAVSVAPPEFPEGGEVRGVQEIQRYFGEWRSAFGVGWWKGLRLEAVAELQDGRVLADVAFELAGRSSGTPVNQLAAVIYTVRDGRIVRAEHFMERAEALRAAGVE
jgi:ketosteroid isomerase-like protein